MNNIINNTYNEIWEEIKKNEKITICTHKNPDGDTIGTAVALKELIILNLENIEVKISGEKAPVIIKFLDQTELVSDYFFENSQKIVVDTSSKNRIWDKRVKTEEAIKIDHHENENKWKKQIGGENWAACGEHIFNLIKRLNLKYNEKILDAIFISVWTDTTGLKYRKISKNTKEAYDFSKKNKDYLVEKLENNPLVEKTNKKIEKYIKVYKNVTTVFVEDFIIDNNLYRSVIDYILSKLNTEVLITCFKQPNGKFRSSIRSKGNFDAGSFAKNNNGGGHFSSAGLKLNSIEEAEMYIEKINKLL